MDLYCVCGELESEHDAEAPRKCLFCDECEGFRPQLDLTPVPVSSRLQ